MSTPSTLHTSHVTPYKPQVQHQTGSAK